LFQISNNPCDKNIKGVEEIMFSWHWSLDCEFLARETA